MNANFWIDKLQTSDREEAVQELIKIGPAAGPALLYASYFLDLDGKRDARDAAVHVLQQMALLETENFFAALTTGNLKVFKEMCRAINLLGWSRYPEPDDIVDLIAGFLKSNNKAKEAAANFLEESGNLRAVPQILDALAEYPRSRWYSLNKDEVKVCCSLVAALQAFHDVGAVPVLAEFLNHPDITVVFYAAHGLRSMGEPAGESIRAAVSQALIGLREIPRPLRELKLLGILGTADCTTAVAIRACDPNTTVRASAIAALGSLPLKPEQAVTVAEMLLAGMGDPEKSVRLAAVQSFTKQHAELAIAYMRSQRGVSVEVARSNILTPLFSALNDEDEHVRRHATFVLTENDWLDAMRSGDVEPVHNGLIEIIGGLIPRAVSQTVAYLGEIPASPPESKARQADQNRRLGKKSAGASTRPTTAKTACKSVSPKVIQRLSSLSNSANAKQAKGNRKPLHSMWNVTGLVARPHGPVSLSLFRPEGAKETRVILSDPLTNQDLFVACVDPAEAACEVAYVRLAKTLGLQCMRSRFAYGLAGSTPWPSATKIDWDAVPYGEWENKNLDSNGDYPPVPPECQEHLLLAHLTQNLLGHGRGEMRAGRFVRCDNLYAFDSHLLKALLNGSSEEQEGAPRLSVSNVLDFMEDFPQSRPLLEKVADLTDRQITRIISRPVSAHNAQIEMYLTARLEAARTTSSRVLRAIMQDGMFRDVAKKNAWVSDAMRSQTALPILAESKGHAEPGAEDDSKTFRWHASGLDPELDITLSHFRSASDELGFEVCTDAPFQAGYRIIPQGQGWSLVARRADDAPSLSCVLTDYNILAHLKDKAGTDVLREIVAVIAVLAVEQTDPWMLNGGPGPENSPQVECLRRRWQAWMACVPAELLLFLRAHAEEETGRNKVPTWRSDRPSHNQVNVQEALNGELVPLWNKSSGAWDYEKAHAVAKKTPDEYGLTALMFAAMSGHTEALSLLLDAGADVQAADKDGSTALMFAASSGHTQGLKLLLKQKSNLEVADTEGCTALMRACKRGQTNSVRLLLKSKANPSTKNKDGMTALMQACQQNHVEIVRLLKDNGANVDAINKNGDTALMWASRRGQVDLANLLRTDAGTNAADKNEALP